MKLSVRGKASSCTRYFKVDLSPQYSTKTLETKNNLVIIKVIPDKLQAVYQLQ
jgi:hypothetical protein